MPNEISLFRQAGSLLHRHSRTRKSRHLVPMGRRSTLVPPTWRVLDDSGPDSFGRGLPPPNTRTLELWRLCLEAKSIPHLVVGHGTTQRIFVPALWEGIARADLAAMALEGKRKAQPRQAPSYTWWALLPLVALFVWHGLSMGWWPLGLEHWPEPDFWLAKGKVDVYRVRMLGEWWRTATALTLHGDSVHLLGNVAFSIPFFFLLCGRMGLGMALTLSILAGVLGNGLNVFYRPFSHSSVGFSTALFGMIGLLCADAAVRENQGNGYRRALLPLAAGLALLALLGTTGERTDYAAHIFGLLSGFVLGAFVSHARNQYGEVSSWLQWLVGLATPALLFWAWHLAYSA